MGDKVSQETENEGDRYGHPRMPCHDHEEGDDARHDRHRPNMRERTSMSMMTGPFRRRPTIPPTNINAGPKKPSIPEHHMRTKLDSGESTNRDGRA